MRNLFDIMREAQGGAALESLSRQFALAPADTQRAVEALLPAFSLAFQQAARDPLAFAHLLQTLLSGRYAPFFDAASPAPAALPGAEVVSRLFGRPEVVSQVASQAAAMTGIGVQILQEMMPVVGATLLGGLLRYATAEGMADLLRQWSEVLSTAAAQVNPKPAARMASDPWSAWFDLIAAMTGTRQPTPPPVPMAAAGPFEAWGQAMGTAFGLPPRAPAGRAPEPPDNPFAALATMFETGREVQAKYLAGLGSILGAVPPPGSRS